MQMYIYTKMIYLSIQKLLLYQYSNIMLYFIYSILYTVILYMHNNIYNYIYTYISAIMFLNTEKHLGVFSLAHF